MEQRQQPLSLPQNHEPSKFSKVLLLMTQVKKKNQM